MKPFHFKQFTVLQSPLVFRVGTDAVLLGALSCVDEVKSVLEVGTGTGIISMMVAQRNPNADIIALDIDENAQILAQQNFENSVFKTRLKCILQDYNLYNPKFLFDLIISNPPYFEENNSKKDNLARQRISLDFQNLIQKSAQLLSDKGRLSIIVPYYYSEEIIDLATKHQLSLARKINIKGIENGDWVRVILEFKKQKTPTEFQEFVIEKSPRKYSDNYIELTKEFHVFGKDGFR